MPPSFLIEPPSPLTVAELNTTVILYWRILSISCNGCLRVYIETAGPIPSNLLYSWPNDHTMMNNYVYNATTTKTDNQNGTSFVDVTLSLLVDENVLETIDYLYCEVTVTSTSEGQWKSANVYLEALYSTTTTATQIPILPTDSTTLTLNQTTNMVSIPAFSNPQNSTDIASSSIIHCCNYYLMLLIMCICQIAFNVQ